MRTEPTIAHLTPNERVRYGWAVRLVRAAGFEIREREKRFRRRPTLKRLLRAEDGR
jgi:hypothetical protein